MNFNERHFSHRFRLRNVAGRTKLLPKNQLSLLWVLAFLIGAKSEKLFLPFKNRNTISENETLNNQARDRKRAAMPLKIHQPKQPFMMKNNERINVNFYRKTHYKLYTAENWRPNYKSVSKCDAHRILNRFLVIDLLIEFGLGDAYMYEPVEIASSCATSKYSIFKRNSTHIAASTAPQLPLYSGA